MPYFYPPPQPVQATPRAPIGNQGDPPPRRTNHALYALRGTWSEPSWPAQYGARIAPQTLTYGDQPPRKTWHSLYQVRATWPEPSWPAQSEPDSASYNVAVVSQPPAGLRNQITLVRQQWAEPVWPAQYNAKVAPLTLIYGDQPPRFNPLQPVWPQPQWNAQSAPPNAAWNVPVIAAPRVSPGPTQWQIWQAWIVPPAPFQRATTLVQPSTGAQPPPFTLHARMAIRQQWPEANWNGRGPAPNASWNRPRVDNPPPLPAVKWNIWATWNKPPEPKQARPTQQINGIAALSDTDVIVPYLIEDVLSAALMRIASIYCVANVIGTTGSVTIQDPVAFTRVPRGTTITITLGGTIKGSGSRKAQAPYGAPDMAPPFPDPKLQRRH